MTSNHLSTTLVAYWIGTPQNKIQKNIVLYWNVIGLVFLANIVSIAILSASTPFQQFGFEQPNKAILYFPFVWLPVFIVPLVLFGHLAAIKQLAAR